MILLLIVYPAFHPVSMVSPLNVSQFTLDLAGHPDRQAVAYVLNGLQHGFRLGFQPARRVQLAKKNKPSAFQNPKVIDDYLATEVARSRVASQILWLIAYVYNEYFEESRELKVIPPRCAFRLLMTSCNFS